MCDGNWFDTLQKSGCRLTAPRRAVVETLEESTCALTPLELYAAAREQYPGLGLVSVYRILEKLEFPDRRTLAASLWLV